MNLTHFYFSPMGSTLKFCYASKFSSRPASKKEYQYLKRMFNANIIQSFGYTYDLQDLDYKRAHTFDGASNVILENKRLRLHLESQIN